MWLTRECILRYLRASKWLVPDATTRLLATLAWRREYILGSHTAEYFSDENATGKQVIMGYDIAARPCLYLNPGQQNTPKSEKQIQHLVFSLERLIDVMEPGQEALVLLINYQEAVKAPSGGQGRQVLKILQSHYPERLGKALLINGKLNTSPLPIPHSPITMLYNLLTRGGEIVSWLFWAFFKLVSPFIDPLTREKIAFDQNLRLFVPPEQLLKPYGGDALFEYDHNVYWPALNELADRRKNELRERWVRGGKRVGEYEGYLRGGEVRSVSEEEEDEVEKVREQEGGGKGKGVEVDKDEKANKLKKVNATG